MTTYDLCKYKNIFGKPTEGAHSYRLFNLAIVDVVMTVLLAFVISYISNFSFLYTTLSLFALGVIAHRMFCVRTTVDKLLFPNVSE
jgi:uncharacterized membrane protein